MGRSEARKKAVNSQTHIALPPGARAEFTLIGPAEGETALFVNRTSGRRVNEGFLRDTVNVPYYDGHSLGYPSVCLRMDFRNPSDKSHLIRQIQSTDNDDSGCMASLASS